MDPAPLREIRLVDADLYLTVEDGETAAPGITVN
jgi:hypothetical protein